MFLDELYNILKYLVNDLFDWILFVKCDVKFNVDKFI